MSLTAYLLVLFSGYVIGVAPPGLDCTTSVALVDGTTNVYYDKQDCK